MARVRIKDKTKSFVADFQASVGVGAVKAAGKLRTFARRRVNKKFFNKLGRTRKDTRAKKDNNTGASKVGESPKRRSGKGYYSIEKTRNIGTRAEPKARTYSQKSKAPYMSMYEYGPKSLRRPWLEPAMRENEKELFTILTTPTKRALRK